MRHPSPHTRQLLRLADVQARTGLERSMVYRLAAKGQFPKPIKLSERASAWDSTAVDAWIAARLGTPTKAAA